MFKRNNVHNSWVTIRNLSGGIDYSLQRKLSATEINLSFIIRLTVYLKFNPGES